MLKHLLKAGYSSLFGPSKPQARRLRKSGGKSTQSTGMTPVNTADIRIKPPAYTVPNRIPRAISNQVVWDVVRVNFTITTSIAAITETNFSFALGSHPQSTSWITLFDQWCIPQFSMTFYVNQSAGSAILSSQFYTALDFDNGALLGTVPLIEDFSTCAVWRNSPDEPTHTRSVKPCIKTRGSTVDNSVIERTWVDSGSPNNPWFGIRTIADIASVAYTITAIATITFAFRNQI